jgi:fibronectin type 3 domain-containing protein
MKLTLVVLMLLLATAAVAQNHSASLTWNQSTSSGVTGNNVYRGTTSGGPYVKIFTSSSPITTYKDSTVAAATTYYYVVTATCTTCNPQESLFSTEVKAVIPSDAPQPPTSLTVTTQ